MMTVREFHAELTRRIVENPEISEYQVCSDDEVVGYGYGARFDKMFVDGDKFVITFY